MIEHTAETDYGISATCWEVEECVINYLTGKAHASLLGWVSQEAKAQGKLPIGKASIVLAVDELDNHTTQNDLDKLIKLKLNDSN